jgi:hypothetical protein
VNFIGEKDTGKLDSVIATYTQKSAPSFGEPYIAIRLKPENVVHLTDNRALHSRIIIDYLGKIKKRGG